MRTLPEWDKLLEDYYTYLMLEKGLSENSCAAYSTDVRKLAAYLSDENTLVADVSLDQLQEFVAGLHDLGIAGSTQARIICGIRSFFEYLHMEGYMDANPALLLETNRHVRKLPEVLTVEEIDACLLYTSDAADD